MPPDSTGEGIAAEGAAPGAGRFAVIRQLGAGGMGVVFEAFDRERGEKVALKTLERLDGAAIYRLKKEFRALADEVHPNLVRLHDLVVDGARCFFTMERVDGVSFLEHVRPSLGDGAIDALAYTAPALAGSTLRERALREALAQLASGVAAIHRAGKLHRDLKPPNVLVTATGRVVILDFGLASPIVEDDRSRDLALAGTPAYMAPEQLRPGGASAASDWYAVGVMLYEALAARLPFEGSAMQMLAAKQLGREPDDLRSVSPSAPRDLAELAMALLRVDPSERAGHAEIVACVGVGGAPALSGPPRAPATVWVGRDHELAQLRAALAAVRAGEPMTVYVAGASGIGKSALVERFLAEASEEALVLRGRCYEREAVAFKSIDAIVDALSRHLQEAGKVAAARVTPRNAAELCRVFPVLERVPAFAEAIGPSAATDSHELRRRAFRALRETLARLAEQRPLIVFIDDLQWGDVDGGAFLTELVAPPEPPRILLLGAYRADEIDRSPVLRMLREHHAQSPSARVETIELAPLATEAAHALARALIGPSEPEGRADAIAREAGGNPFLLAELARLSAAHGEVVVGATLRDLVTAHVSGLGDDARRLLEMVALAGGPLPRSVALAAAGMDGTRDDAVRHLVSASLLRSSGDRVETYHDKIRETVAASLTAPTSRAHHAALARALAAEIDPPAARLAVHYREAGERELAGTWARRAAERARDALAFDHAAELFRQALALTPDDRPSAARRELERELAEALAHAGRAREAAELFRRAAEGAPEDEAIELEGRAVYEIVRTSDRLAARAAVRAYLARLGMWVPRTHFGAVIAGVLLFYVWIAILLVRDVSRARRSERAGTRDLARLDACLSLSQALMLVDNGQAAYFGARALPLAIRVGEPGRLAAALGIYAGTAQMGALPRAEARIRAQLDRVLARGRDERTIARTRAFHIASAYTSGELQRVAELVAAVIPTLERFPGMRAELDMTSAYQLWTKCMLGDVRAVASEAPAVARRAKMVGNEWLRAVMSSSLIALGRLADDEAELAAREADETLERWQEPVPRLWHFEARGLIDLYRGQPAELDAIVRRHLPAVRRSGVMLMPYTAVLVLGARARLALALGEREPDIAARRALARQAEAFARSIARCRIAHAAPISALVSAGARSLLADPAGAADALERAIASADAIGLRLHAAVARARLADLREGAPRETLRAASDSYMQEQAIVRPDRFVAMLAPGFAGVPEPASPAMNAN